MSESRQPDSLTAFPEEERQMRQQLARAPLARASLRRPLPSCDLTHCRGMCCHDGVYVEDEAADVLEALAKQEAGFFASLGLDLPARVIVEGSWRRGLVQGKKTAVVPHSFSHTVPGFPAHFPDTACVFHVADGRCGLQVLSEARGRHKWYYKPIGCWLHPLTTSYGGRRRIGLYDERSDPFRFADYPGFVSATFCGRNASTGSPASQVLREELQLLGQILGRDLHESNSP